jgi:hypothetical protein
VIQNPTYDALDGDNGQPQDAPESEEGGSDDDSGTWITINDSDESGSEEEGGGRPPYPIYEPDALRACVAGVTASASVSRASSELASDTAAPEHEYDDPDGVYGQLEEAEAALDEAVVALGDVPAAGGAQQLAAEAERLRNEAQELQNQLEHLRRIRDNLAQRLEESQRTVQREGLLRSTVMHEKTELVRLIQQRDLDLEEARQNYDVDLANAIREKNEIEDQLRALLSAGRGDAQPQAEGGGGKKPELELQRRLEEAEDHIRHLERLKNAYEGNQAEYKKAFSRFAEEKAQFEAQVNSLKRELGQYSAHAKQSLEQLHEVHNMERRKLQQQLAECEEEKRRAENEGRRRFFEGFHRGQERGVQQFQGDLNQFIAAHDEVVEELASQIAHRDKAIGILRQALFEIGKAFTGRNSGAVAGALGFSQADQTFSSADIVSGSTELLQGGLSPGLMERLQAIRRNYGEHMRRGRTVDLQGWKNALAKLQRRLLRPFANSNLTLELPRPGSGVPGQLALPTKPSSVDPALASTSSLSESRAELLQKQAEAAVRLIPFPRSRPPLGPAFADVRQTRNPPVRLALSAQTSSADLSGASLATVSEDQTVSADVLRLKDKIKTDAERLRSELLEILKILGAAPSEDFGSYNGLIQDINRLLEEKDLSEVSQMLEPLKGLKGLMNQNLDELVRYIDTTNSRLQFTFKAEERAERARDHQTLEQIAKEIGEMAGKSYDLRLSTSSTLTLCQNILIQFQGIKDALETLGDEDEPVSEDLASMVSDYSFDQSAMEAFNEYLNKSANANASLQLLGAGDADISRLVRELSPVQSLSREPTPEIRGSPRKPSWDLTFTEDSFLRTGRTTPLPTTQSATARPKVGLAARLPPKGASQDASAEGEGDLSFNPGSPQGRSTPVEEGTGLPEEGEGDAGSPQSRLQATFLGGLDDQGTKRQPISFESLFTYYRKKRVHVDDFMHYTGRKFQQLQSSMGTNIPKKKSVNVLDLIKKIGTGVFPLFKHVYKMGDSVQEIMKARDPGTKVQNIWNVRNPQTGGGPASSPGFAIEAMMFYSATVFQLFFGDGCSARFAPSTQEDEDGNCLTFVLPDGEPIFEIFFPTDSDWTVWVDQGAHTEGWIDKKGKMRHPEYEGENKRPVEPGTEIERFSALYIGVKRKDQKKLSDKESEELYRTFGEYSEGESAGVV